MIVRAWERIGYARLSDYAVERLGLSARWVQSLAQVGEGFRVCPGLEEALVSGALGWTKVRLLASLPPGEEQAGWLARARRLTAEQLSKQVRAVDRGSVDAAEASEATGHSRVFEARCSPDVRWKWYVARGAASRAAGRMLHVAEAAELIAAEVLSALPLDEDEDADQEACDEAGASWSPETEEEAGGSELVAKGSASRSTSASAERCPWNSVSTLASARCSPWPGTTGCTGRWDTRPARPTRASASEWIPPVPAPSCASSARPS